MTECSAEAPWGYHPELRGDVCGRCGFVARDEEESVERRVDRSGAPALQELPLAA